MPSSFPMLLTQALRLIAPIPSFPFLLSLQREDSVCPRFRVAHLRPFRFSSPRSTRSPLNPVRRFPDHPEIAMDKQQNRKILSVEARLRRKLILRKKRINRFRSSNGSENMLHHANDDNHLSRPAMYIETGGQSMANKMIHGMPLSDNSKDQGTSFANHNIFTARFGRPLESGRHIIRENNYVSPGEPEIHSTTHLEEVEGNHSNSDEKGLSKNDNSKYIGVLNTGRGTCSAIVMKRSFPWDNRVDVSVSALDSSSPNSTSNGLLANPIPNLPTIHIPLPTPCIGINSQDVLIRRASMYQDYMEQIPIPSHRGSVIPFTSWMGLGKSIKQLYGQPLHYLTNILLKQWDKLRIGSEDEDKPLDDIIHPCKAEATIWLMEEVHRQTSSHFHIANLWKMDPMYNGFVDSIFPALEHTS